MELFYCAIIAALLVYMLDYGFGHPGNEQPNVNALLFVWPFYLAKRAMQKAGVWDAVYKQYLDQIAAATNGLHVARIKRSFKEMVYNEGRELFTWQSIVGMCPICTHFWINIIFLSLVNIFCLKENIFIFMLHFLVGHLVLRITKKYF